MHSSPTSSVLLKKSFRFPKRRSRSGMALLLVLAGVVLITGIAVALLMRVEGGRVVSGAYSKSIEARMLADSAANIVIGQIRDATADGELAWASQPGAIRTFDTSGRFVRGYKLYSSSIMVEDQESDLADEDYESLVGWQSKPGQYIDLNEPSNGHYPIINPELKELDIAGFDNTQGSEDLRWFQMPVEWLYILKDGTLTSGSYQQGRVTFGGANQPTKNNPIQARVAFWADDETAKININTASEGLFWDTPRANTKISNADKANQYTAKNTTGTFYNAAESNPTNPPNPATDYERGLAFIQPANREYNRYPGHPAMNCLSVLLENSRDNLYAGVDQDDLQNIFRFASVLRNPDGDLRGSRMGGFQVSPADPSGSLVELGDFPLYATLDEAAMVSSLSSNTETRPQSDLFEKPKDLELREFLMTASSRAPELNIFNRPRIAMWPVSDPDLGDLDPNEPRPRRTAYDNLIERCGTISNRDNVGQKWHFLIQRRNAYSMTEDMTINQDLYEYLNELLEAPVPGWGGSFSGKYSGYKTLSLQILDYIRCTNLFDASLEGANYGSNPNAATTGRQFTTGLGNNKVGLLGHGQVLPMRNGDVQGLGRTPTIDEVALAIICTGDAQNTESASARMVAQNLSLEANLTGTQKRYQVMLLPSFANPLPGNPNMVPSIIVEVEGLDSLTINNVTPYKGWGTLSGGETLRASTPLVTTNKGAGTWFGIGGGSNLGIMPLVALATAPKRGRNPALQADPSYSLDAYGGSSVMNTSVNELMSDFFTLPTGGFITLSCEPITISLYYKDENGNKVSPAYQTFKVPLGLLAKPSGDISLPALQPHSQGRGSNDSTGGFNAGEYFWSFNRRGVVNPYNSGRLDHIIRNADWQAKRPRPALFFNPIYDVVLSVQLKNGDYRRTALMKEVPITEWVATPSPTTRSAINGTVPGINAHNLSQDTANIEPAPTTDAKYNVHSIQTVNGRADTYPYFVPGEWVNDVRGRLVPTSKGVNYNQVALPAISKSVDDSYKPANNWHGDWDNGMAAQPDGPYSNLPDSGNMFQEPTNPASINSNPPYYYNPNLEFGVSALFFSPNRMIPSSGMLGSLTTESWTTLLFRPLGTTRGSHPGSQSPPDHLIMDLFWMPVVDPYAISEPFSTAGKINMNYQILPFKHIERKTGLYSVLKAEKMMAIPNGEAAGSSTTSGGYKVFGATKSYRHSIDIKETLEQFDERFDSGEIFVSASEICDIYLVPKGRTLNDVKGSFWNDHLLTGDNTKERPYTNIYPRLTTKSNTYRVHYRVQVLKKVTGTPDDQFVDPNDPGASGFKDQILSEQRGSYIIERYLEHNDPRFGVSIDPMNESLNKAYKFRVVGAKQFNP
jgi:uncharacterized protein (TIGR02600 family)